MHMVTIRNIAYEQLLNLTQLLSIVNKMRFPNKKIGFVEVNTGLYDAVVR